jgi:hypothetical protein
MPSSITVKPASTYPFVFEPLGPCPEVLPATIRAASQFGKSRALVGLGLAMILISLPAASALPLWFMSGGWSRVAPPLDFISKMGALASVPVMVGALYLVLRGFGWRERSREVRIDAMQFFVRDQRSQKVTEHGISRNDIVGVVLHVDTYDGGAHQWAELRSPDPNRSILLISERSTAIDPRPQLEARKWAKLLGVPMYLQAAPDRLEPDDQPWPGKVMG